jgi:CRISPR-associated protein Csm4
MRWLTATLLPQSAFGTLMKGDTLFGQICWAIRHRAGEKVLESLLDGYTQGNPFLVVSDAFPNGLAPRPELPPRAENATGEPEEERALKRKAEKRRRFLPRDALTLPMHEAMEAAVEGPAWTAAAQPHAAISRATGTTGAGSDPYQMQRQWPQRDLRLEVHLLFDPARLERVLLETALSDIGAFGFGRDASIGLGRFVIEGWAEEQPKGAGEPDSLLALAPCAAPDSFDPSRSFWKPFVRFGRHGAEAAHGNPFKKPVLLMDTGAVLAAPIGRGFAGRGLGGSGTLSTIVPGTVHQGYAPVIPIRVGDWG